MAEPATTPVPSATDEYRPLSLLAVVGLGLGGLSILVYLFDAGWLLILPLTGLAVSGIALRQIKRSDNAQAGAGVARLGMALSLVIGLSWATMYLTRDFVLQSEATSFLEKWFECVREGNDRLAFIASVRPGSRPAVLRSEDLDLRAIRSKYPSPQGPAYDLFRTSPLAELLLRGGKDIAWRHIRIEDFYYQHGSFYLKHRYWIDTPEVAMEVTIPMSSEQVDRSGLGPRREWRIDVSSAVLHSATSKSKPFGNELTQARTEAHRALQRWVGLVSLAKKDEAAALLSGGPALNAEFERLYPAMRRDVPSLAAVAVKGRHPLVLTAQQHGPRWTLTFRSTIEVGRYETEFQTTWENDDLGADPKNWRLVDLQYLGDRERVDTQIRSVGGAQR